MAELTPRLAEILRMYLSEEELKTACWQHTKSRRWLIHHWPLMTIKTRAGIVLDRPEHILERAEPDTVVLRQSGHVAHKGVVYEAWAYGVADRENCHIPHRYPIARKRGEDIVILELLGLMHDYAVRGELYGEDEADWDGPKSAAKAELRERKEELASEVEALVDRAEPPALSEWKARVNAATTLEELGALYNEFKPHHHEYTPAETNSLVKLMERRGKKIGEEPA